MKHKNLYRVIKFQIKWIDKSVIGNWKYYLDKKESIGYKGI